MVPLFSLFKGSVYCSLSAKSKPISEVSTLALPWPVCYGPLGMDSTWAGDGSDCSGDSLGDTFAF